MSAAGRWSGQLEQVRTLVARRFGHQCVRERGADLERILELAAKASGYREPERYVQDLLTEGAEDRLGARLFAELAVGETYFFRDPEALAAVENALLPTLAAQEPGRVIRAWSAGCATGEEPYSLAILFARARSRFPALRFDLRASDLKASALERARAGIFREWSFRSAPAWLKPAYFEPAADGCWRLRRGRCEPVDFFTLNLAGDAFPSASNGTTGLDLILCRNVLLYFTAEQFARTLHRLASALRPGGWLVLSAVEVAHVCDPLLRPHRVGGATVLVRVGEQAETAAARNGVERHSAPAAPARHGRVPPAGPMRRLEPHPRREAPAAPRIGAAPVEASRPEGHLLDPARHLRAAWEQQEAGAWSEAELSLRRALYLEPVHVAARVSLGFVLMRRQRTEEACRCFQHALAQLRRMPPSAPVPDMDLPSGMMAGMLQSLLAKAQGSAPAGGGGRA